jgi:hypothetical protein
MATGLLDVNESLGFDAALQWDAMLLERPRNAHFAGIHDLLYPRGREN